MKKPETRNEFLNTTDERNHLSDMVQYFASRDQCQSEEAAPYLRRFQELLDECGPDDGSIMLQDHWALLHEVRSELPKAIMHREREIELTEQLLAIGGPVGPINEAFLAEKLCALARDYSQTGEFNKANELLRRANRAAEQ
jgi:hypothetical protein